MKITSLLFALFAAAGIASLAQAQTIVPKLDQDGRKGDMARMAHKQAQEKFDGADANKDGKLSPEETAKNLPYVAENFGKYDKDKDGALSWEEYVGHNRWKKD